MRPRGYIDGVFGDAVRGWAVDLDSPGTPLRIAVRFDGFAQLVALADEPRDDLARAGIGTGTGGFRVHLGHVPAPGDHEIVALVDGTTTPIPLASDFRVVGTDGAARPDVRLHEEHAPQPIAPPVLPREALDELPNTGAEAVPADIPAGSHDALLAGENGWLFACPGTGFDLLRGVARPARTRLDEVVATLLRLQDAASGPALFAILPDKLFVYPEHAPVTMPLHPAGRLAEHLAARAQDDDRLRLLDLLPTLLRARAHGRLFNRGTAGPTWMGAFHAYRAIGKALSDAIPALVPCPVADVTTGPAEPVPDDSSALEIVSWQGSSFGARHPPAPHAGTEEPLAGFGAPDVAARPALEIAHDDATQRIAELLAAHGDPATRVDATAPVAANQRADAFVWVVSDLTLVRLASSDPGSRTPS